MGNVATYDARKVTTTVGGLFITGFAEGTFVSASKDEDNFEPTVSAQGDVAVAVRNNTLGTIEFTLNQTSPSISYLDRLANNSTMVPAWVISNNTAKEVSGGTMAMVTKPADKEYADTVSERTFTLKVFDYKSE
ncbi:phage structural protein [Psychrobacillus psychrotolerans]|uniref:phage structural protein n=1 Tax=Psychrobacillus psychrotolerans TaxID=126156 RepID=UPI003B0144FA